MGEEQVDLERLLRELESSEAEVRRRALFKLGKSLDLSAIPRVKQIAADDDSQEARYLARKLLALYEARRPEASVLIRPGGSHPSLANALDSPADIEAALSSENPVARAAALKACIERKDAGLLPALLRRAGPGADGRPAEPVPEIRSMIPQALARIAGRSQVQTIVSFLDDPDPRVRANALTEIQGVGDPESWAFVIRSVQDPDHRVKTAALSALSKLGRINVIKCCRIMIERSGSKYWQRDSAIALLARSGLPEAVPFLEAALTDPVPGIAQKAFKGLQNLAARGHDAAKKSLATAIDLGIGEEKPEDFLKLEAAPATSKPEHDTGLWRELTKVVLAEAGTSTIVGQIRLEKDVPTLVGMLRNLSRRPDPAAIPTLVELLEHEAEEVRGECIRALVAIGTPDALGLIVPLVSDPSPVVASRALLALEQHPDAGVRDLAEDAKARFVRRAPQRVKSAGTSSVGPSSGLQTIDTSMDSAPLPSVSPSGIWQAPSPFSAKFSADFEMVKPLGQGGMGAVYLMRQKKLDRLVAVKVVRPERFTKDESDRLLKEARVLASVNHANIVAIHDVGTDGELPYMVCEYVEGETLQDRLANQPPLPLASALTIARQILEGLAAAHRAGVQHRDIKPANLLLTRDAKPKIVDFGLARSTKAPAGASIGAIAGTPAYMSPEQARGQETTAASDLYSVGVIVFEMTVGRHPFPGPEMMDYLMQHVSETPPLARSLRPELPAVLEQLLARSLEKEPAKRFVTAGEFHEALLEPIAALAPPSKPGRPGVPPPATGLAPGTRLAGRYALDRLLAEREIETVWLARDTARGNTGVALRFLPARLWNDVQARATLIQEGQRSARLSHPAILGITGVDSGDPPFLVTELVEAATLAEELSRRQSSGEPPLGVPETLTLLEAVAAALDHAHGSDILHLEVTPSRILLVPGAPGSPARWTPVLEQFGLAAELNKLVTASTGAMPTDALAYLSPEQLTSRPLDARADVFALAATACQMLTLQVPSPAEPSSLGALEPPAAAVIFRALLPDRELRPPTAGAFVRELRQALEAPKTPAAPGPSPAAPVPAPGVDPRPRLRLHWAVLVAIVLALALATRMLR